MDAAFWVEQRERDLMMSCCRSNFRNVLLFCVISVAVFAAQAMAQRAKQPMQVEADRATLVILAPLGPVFADLRISVAKMPYRTWVGRFLAVQMDVDRNDRLDSKELELLTDSIRRLANVPGPDEILAGMNPSGDATDVAAADFAKWLSQRLPRAFDLIAQPQSSDDAVRLTSLIDSDQNAKVSEEELQAAMRTLRFRDLDNDETFSVSELMPYRDPRSQNAAVTPDVVSLPFFHVTDQASGDLAAERILKRYGADGTLDVAVLRQPEVPAAGTAVTIDLEALKAVLMSPVHHLTLDVRLSDNANTSDVDVTISPAASAYCTVTDDSFGQSAMTIDGMPLKVVARGGGKNNRTATRGFLGQTFVMIDADKNQYLDETEFAGIVAALQQSGASGDFVTVDRNGDKMVTRDELFSFAERDQMTSASRIEVTVMQDGKTLYGLLDTNQDRRLSAREIRSGGDVLKQFDVNSDGGFAETELGTEYILTLGLGRPEIRRNSGSMEMMNPGQMNRLDAILPGTSALSGPEWFKRMDRNQDGDVSRREFPGSAEDFRQLDTDADQLITAAEAEAVEPTATAAP
jgi:Ca2+-binding EF-hand superfamily protein